MQQAFTNEDILLLKSKTRKFILFYILVSVVFFSGVAILFVTSKRETFYIQTIVNCVLTVAYGWFSIYFFTIPYRELAQTTKTYNSIIDAEQVEEILVVKEIVNDYQKERNLITLVKLVDEQGNDRVLYLLKPIELSKNTKYKFVSKANYIVSYEVKK